MQPSLCTNGPFYIVNLQNLGNAHITLVLKSRKLWNLKYNMIKKHHWYQESNFFLWTRNCIRHCWIFRRNLGHSHFFCDHCARKLYFHIIIFSSIYILWVEVCLEKENIKLNTYTIFCGFLFICLFFVPGSNLGPWAF